MVIQAILSNLQEVKSFFSMLQREYGAALSQGDIMGRIEISGSLSAAYALIGNMVLARKWAEEVKAALHECAHAN